MARHKIKFFGLFRRKCAKRSVFVTFGRNSENTCFCTFLQTGFFKNDCFLQFIFSEFCFENSMISILPRLACGRKSCFGCYGYRKYREKHRKTPILEIAGNVPRIRHLLERPRRTLPPHEGHRNHRFHVIPPNRIHYAINHE